MTQTKPNRALNSTTKAVLAFGAIAFITTSPYTAQAQDNYLIVTPQQAKVVIGTIQDDEFDADIDGRDIRALGLDLSSDIQTPAQNYADNNLPVIALDARDNTDFTLGALPIGDADGKTYRDPYAIENIDMNPIYPEGRYVDTMRANAGLGLSSEF